jgi:putative membrane protein
MFHKSKIITALFSLTLLASTAFAKDKEAHPHDSEAFLKSAALSGIGEVSLAKLALKKAVNPDIQSFAKMMVADHEAANAEVTRLAKPLDVTLPTQIGARRNGIERKMRKLNDRDRAFDRAYIEQAVEDHKKAIELFEKQAAHGTDADVKAFAAATLPKLKEHYDLAGSLATKLNSKPNMN